MRKREVHFGLSSAHAIVSTASFFALEVISEDNERPVLVQVF